MTLIPAMLAATVFVECENFEKLGGWVVETQSMRQLGSSYVMAHGYGNPVADAWTIAGFPVDGEYTVWARTRNWNAVWTKGAAGRFQIAVGNEKQSSAWVSGELGA
ncbi:MAG: pyridine nucleotide-disulfide oxidoreductase, partial [Kiritimatiellae bacterium]|nr:pyridine nucleotide-disulfide oxidoreductase [Kiritimatiellia bacterium]